jgi:hypothetical protein
MSNNELRQTWINEAATVNFNVFTSRPLLPTQITKIREIVEKIEGLIRAVNNE